MPCCASQKAMASKKPFGSVLVNRSAQWSPAAAKHGCRIKSCYFLARFGGGHCGSVLWPGVEIAVPGGAIRAVPLGEGFPHEAVDGGSILRDQLQPLVQALRREVNSAEE